MPTSSARSSKRGGYTLAELLVALVIIALTLAIVGPRLYFSSDAALADRAVRSFESAARAARAEARLSGSDTVLTVNLDTAVLRIEPSGQEFRLPEQLALTATVAEAELDPPLAGIRFFPDGSSTGGDVGVALGDAERALTIEWITGRVNAAPEGDRDE
jgi:general secretion pathway protein H